MIDQVQAAQMLLSYKRKALTYDQILGLLCSICGMTEQQANVAIAYADKMPVQYLQKQEQVWIESQKQSKH